MNLHIIPIVGAHCAVRNCELPNDDYGAIPYIQDTSCFTGKYISTTSSLLTFCTQEVPIGEPYAYLAVVKDENLVIII